MAEILYSEIIPYPGSGGKWKEITFNAGATQSTLQEIKLPDGAGFYSYQDSNSLGGPVSNRFIYWRVTHDILELVELSLDATLISNQLKIRFQQSPVLDGISIHEIESHVIILISTVASVHRLAFTHPCKLKEFATVNSSEILLPSIFYDVAVANIRNPSTYHVLNNVAEGNALPHISCSWLTPEQEAVFVLANNTGFLQVVIMDPHSNKISSFELRQASYLSRLSYLVPVIRSNSSDNITMGLIQHVFQDDSLIIAFGKDLKIKLWSFESRECLKSESILELAGHNPNINFSEVTDAKICKALDSDRNTLILGVYINHYENLFCILQVAKESDGYFIHHLATITGPELDLVDFKLSFNQLWTLWLNGDSQAVVKFMNLDSHQDKVWKHTSLLPPIGKAYHPKHLETREVYLKEIFYPGRFSNTIISKAIISYRRDVELYLPPDITLESLKDQVITAIENQIHGQACQSELSLDDYIALQVDCWETFFSYCIQYHEVGTRVLGLCIDVDTGFTGIIKENFISFLRPCDDMESIVLSNSSIEKPLNFKDNAIVTQNPSLLKSLQKLLDCLNILHSTINCETSFTFCTKLHFFKSPSKLAQKLVSELSSSVSIEKELETHLSLLPNFSAACQLLIDALDLGQIEDQLYEMQESTSPANLLFTSATGFNSVSEGVQQFAQNRYLFCRNLLILQHFVLKLGEKSGQQIVAGVNELIAKTSSLCANYYVLCWSTQCQTVPVTANTGEIAIQHMSLLSLNDAVNIERPTSSRSILEVFLREQGGKLAHNILFQEDQKQEYIWSNILPSLIIIISKLLWPSNRSLYFPQFLLSQSQYLPLQQYLRLLNMCTSENRCSRSFLYANCLLFMNESHHAIELLIQASKGTLQEPFLYSKLLHSTLDVEPSELQARYFFKVINLLEHFNLPDCIIQIASHHLNSLQSTDPNFAAFHTVLFGNYLELGHLEEAFNSLLNNTGDSKKVCLRKFVSVLCERKQFDKLVQFKYIELEKDFISILVGRARSGDLLSHNYYELLFSYYINNHNYRGAGRTMYEQALRLGRETYGSSICLSKQVKCYLATMNCLKVGDPNFHWIIKPDLKFLCRDEDSPNMSPKRNYDGEEIIPTITESDIEIVHISDIQKQFHLARARLSLYYLDSSPTNLALSPMAPQEVITLLVSNGLFDEAINLSLSYSLSLVPIFEGFILKSLHQQENKDRWNWLQRNDTSTLPVTKEDNLAWLLLKQYLNAHELPGQSEYHKAVVIKLFSFNFSELPLWLLHSYQRRNAPELLWLYIQYGYLEKATTMAISYIDAVLGLGKNYFNLKTPLKSAKPAVWLPYSLLNTLIELLDERLNDSNNKELYDKLERKLKNYFNELECQTMKLTTPSSMISAN